MESALQNPIFKIPEIVYPRQDPIDQLNEHRTDSNLNTVIAAHPRNYIFFTKGNQ